MPAEIFKQLAHIQMLFGVDDDLFHAAFFQCLLDKLKELYPCPAFAVLFAEKIDI